MQMNRQTDLSLEQLLERLPGAESCAHHVPSGRSLPRGLIVNEIGQIFWADGKEAQQAQTKLCELLESSDHGDRFIAYHYLVAMSDAMDDEVRGKLDRFARNPANEQIMARLNPC